jgi:hypothetical protein
MCTQVTYLVAVCINEYQCVRTNTTICVPCVFFQRHVLGLELFVFGSLSY